MSMAPASPAPDLAMDGQSPTSPLRIVIVPWLAFGHLLPFLELAEQLAERGHHVSYVSTPRNLARLQLLRPATALRVSLVAVPLPRVDGLPDGAESTNDVPGDDRELHWKAFDGLAAPFAEFLSGACANEATRPHWIIADTFLHWAAACAVEHKVPCAMLLSTAAMLVSLLQPSAAASLPRHEQEARAPALANPGASGMSIFQRFSLTKERCTVGAIRSCVEWEPESFPVAVALFGKPVLTLGLLPPSPVGGRHATRSEHATVRWLDAQPPNSVVYVALGSEVPLPAEQLNELALGLELAGTGFLWALRKPSGVAVLDNDDGSDMLPPGFRKRTHAAGLVATGWVPQTSILAHASVGGFLTHCGRSSLVEGLLCGHPLVMLPIAGDQGPNARQMEARKVGLQVARDAKDGSFDRHGIASAVWAVMVDGEARRGFVAAAAKMKEVVADKELHDRYIDEFIQQLRSYAAGSCATAALNSS